MKELHNDTHYPGNVTIHYPLHPFHGRELRVSRRFGRSETLQFELEVDDRRLLVPAWMTDVDCCRRLTSGDEPRVSVTALLQLACLLDAADL